MFILLCSQSNWMKAFFFGSCEWHLIFLMVLSLLWCFFIFWFAQSPQTIFTILGCKLHADSLPSVALYIIANVSYKPLDRVDFTYPPPAPLSLPAYFCAHIDMFLSLVVSMRSFTPEKTTVVFSRSLLAKTAFCHSLKIQKTFFTKWYVTAL